MTDELKIITNHHPRDIIDAYELTAEERTRFDYLDWPAIDAGTDSASFFRYRGELYDLGEFSVWQTRPDALREWDGYLGESFFSAVVVRLVDNGERVIVGVRAARTRHGGARCEPCARRARTGSTHTNGEARS